MGRHERTDDGPDLAGLIEACGMVPPAPRTPPTDALRCPDCRSVTGIVRWGARARCGGCGAEWAIGADLAAQQNRAAGRRAYDALADGGQLEGLDR